MKFSTYSLAITYVMAALGLCAIWLVEASAPAFVLVTAGFIVLSLVFNIKKRDMLPGRVWNLLAVAMLVFFIIDYISISSSFIGAATRFATVLLVLKLFDLKRNRDYFIAYALIFFQLLAAAASTVSPLFVGLLTLYIIGGILAMIIFSVKSDFYAAYGRLEVPNSTFGAGFFLTMAVVTGASLVMTLLLFFIIPRMGIGFLHTKTTETIKVSGFSNTVVLGALGEVKRDPTVIMRVQPSSPVNGHLYIRGESYDHYDGKSWSTAIRKRRLLRSPAGVFRFGPMNAGVIEQKILLEPLETEVLFGASHFVGVRGEFKNIWVDSTGTVRLPSPPYSRMEYTAWSATGPMPGPRAGAFRKEYLDLGFLDNTPGRARIIELAKSITGKAKNPADKALAIDGYLKDNYRYSLDPARDEKRPPLDDFLFYSKEGFCEHYATAMAVLLRAVGIPSRIVTGFAPDEWNSLGGYYVVRAQDSHSWVEAYIDGVGWKTYDPTPGAAYGAERHATVLSDYVDLVRWRWNRYIVYFSSDDQREMGGALGTGASGVFAKARSMVGPLGAMKGPNNAGLLVALVSLTAALVWLRRSSFRIKESRTQGYYMEMLRIVGKRGLTKRGDETALEFSSRAASPGVSTITEAYQAERYGNVHPTEAEEFRIKQALETLKRRGV